MYLTFLVLSICFVQITCRLEALPDELSTRVSLCQCVHSAVDYFAKYGEIISLSLSLSPPVPNKPAAVPLEPILISQLFLNNKFTLMTRKAVLSVPFDTLFRKISSYIIQIRQFEEISQTLKILKEDILWNPQANFFIISTTEFDNVTSILKQTVENLSKYKIVNVVIMFPAQENNVIYKVYTWFPFSDGKCGNDFEVELIDSCAYGIFTNNGWFKEKTPKNLGNCSVRVRTTIIPPFVMPSNSSDRLDGFEIQLLNTVADVTNLSLIYSLSEQYDRYGDITYMNGSATGSYSDLINESVDIMMGYVVPRLDNQFHFDIIPSYFQDSLVICVPHSKPKTDWMELTSVAKTSVVSLCILLIVLITFIIFGFSRIHSGEVDTFKSLLGISFNLFGLLMGTSVVRLPKSEKIRVLLMLWIIFSLHFRAAYVSNLTTTLTKMKYDDEMTLEDIYNRKLTLLLYPLCKRYLDVSMLEQHTKVSVCDNITECLHRTAYKEDSATCTSRLSVNYLLHNFIDENGKPKLHCFKNNLVTFPIQMLMWKGYPFKKRIERLVEKLNGAGFIFKWERNIFENSCKGQTRTQKTGETNTVLNITNLSDVFLLFGIGILISIVTFVLEILMYWKPIEF